jgi:preprotein translocase subunit SecG
MELIAQFGMGRFLLAWLIIAICAVLMLVILVQKGRGTGLSGAFGGGGGAGSAFGAKTGDVFTWITVGLAALFVVIAITANFIFEQSKAAAPPVAAAPAPAPATPTPQPVTTPPQPVTTPPITTTAVPAPATGASPTSGPRIKIQPVPGAKKTEPGATPASGPRIKIQPAPGAKTTEPEEGARPQPASGQGTQTPPQTSEAPEDRGESEPEQPAPAEPSSGDEPAGDTDDNP